MRKAADADPQLYEAPLYAGDTAFRQKDMAAAGRWYARAIAVDPNRETAYRYWGDATLAMSMKGDPNSKEFEGQIKSLGALPKAKYLDAMVAKPYKSLSWEGIKKWAKLRNATLRAPKIDRPAAPTVDTTNPDKVVVHIDPNRYMGKTQGFLQSWMMYSILRADYLKERFKKEFPEAKEYRHTLKEESFALGMVVKTVREKNIPDQDMD